MGSATTSGDGIVNPDLPRREPGSSGYQRWMGGELYEHQVQVVATPNAEWSAEDLAFLGSNMGGRLSLRVRGEELPEGRCTTGKPLHNPKH
ncbi:hypothetical protein [Saccharopolyspora elongata]|uniref:Uncharacterized protein n=1 Tax=Saccharopolyspora elongata TaxID=2530387 RepID=A0A4R4YC43_9PSEU|nr:hypothetical protein [Saccharopolyspora elongata]TDD41359.1 hypothetical protein E1288_32800 [Saccharopolyspora elongata]